MTYVKPQLAAMGSAITAIQASLVKDQPALDGISRSDDAYVSDEK